MASPSMLRPGGLGGGGGRGGEGAGWRQSPFVAVPNIIGYARLALVLAGLQLSLPGRAGPACCAGRGAPGAGAGAGGIGDGLYWSLLKLSRNLAMRWVGGGAAYGTEQTAACAPAGGVDRVAIGMALYCAGFLLDGVDGHAARYLNQARARSRGRSRKP